MNEAPIPYGTISIPGQRDLRKEQAFLFRKLSDLYADIAILYSSQWTITDEHLQVINNYSRKFAEDHKKKNISADRFSKYAETFPAMINALLGGEFPLKLSKTPYYVDIAFGVDALVELRSGAVFGIDVTINPEFSDVHIVGNYNLARYDIDKRKFEGEAEHLNNFYSVVVYIDKEKFLTKFKILNEAGDLTREEIFIILLEEFYIRPIYRHLTHNLKNGEYDFDKIYADIESKDNELYFGNRKLSHFTDREKYILEILLSIRSDFYGSEEYQKLRKQARTP